VNRPTVAGTGSCAHGTPAGDAGPLDLVALVRWLAPTPVPNDNGLGLGPCWASARTGYRTSDGYASVKVSARAPSLRAHRLLWTMLHGPLAPGLVLHHRCATAEDGHRWCLRPSHLQPLTRSAHAALHHRLRAAAKAA